MAKKGFIGSFFKALIVAVVVFFIVFFFAPEMSQKYLGTSYKHDKTKVDVAVQDSVSDLMESAYALSVPLKVGIETASDWGGMH